MSDTQPLIKGRKPVVVLIVLETLVIAYLVTQAIAGQQEWRVWYWVSAAALTALIGVVAWTRLRR